MGMMRVAGVAAVVAALVTLRGWGAEADKNECKIAHPGADGKLVYMPDAKGNTLCDFSHCGYKGGGVRLPEAAVRATVMPEAGSKDDTARIQQAIETVAKLPRDQEGLRGAVLLKKGVYRIGGQLKIEASGLVLRGEGDGENDTVLLATGTAKRVVIQIGGKNGAEPQPETRQVITDEYVPVGARSFTVKDATGFKVGDTVLVSRIGNAEWIHAIGMDRIKPNPKNPEGTVQWKPFNLAFDRVIEKIEGNRITIDAPLVCAMEKAWGGGEVCRYTDPERIEQVGVERLRGDTEFDANKTAKAGGKEYCSDEDHATGLVGFEAVKNAWVRDVTAIHFYHGVMHTSPKSKWITVQDSAALDPVSAITGARRYPFSIGGQLALVQRCYARKARHAFVVGAWLPGPNVFLDCSSDENYTTSEPHQRWSTGGLYDNVRAPLAIQDRQYMGTGHGWSGANYVVWNCEGTLICQQPPTAENWAIGQVGSKVKSAFARPEGYWESLGKHVEPRSLYLKQLEDRLGKQAVEAIAGERRWK